MPFDAKNAPLPERRNELPELGLPDAQLLPKLQQGILKRYVRFVVVQLAARDL